MINFSNLVALTVPEGNVQKISIGDNVIWSSIKNILNDKDMANWSVRKQDTNVKNPVAFNEDKLTFDLGTHNSLNPHVQLVYLPFLDLREYNTLSIEVEPIQGYMSYFTYGIAKTSTNDSWWGHYGGVYMDKWAKYEWYWPQDNNPTKTSFTLDISTVTSGYFALAIEGYDKSEPRCYVNIKSIKLSK